MNSFVKKNPVFLAIILTYAFSVLCRYYWIYWAQGNEDFFFNSQLMINTNDGYAFAEGAKERILGWQAHPLSYYNSALSFLTYLLYKLSPFSLETLMLYMSTFISSLLVIPAILLGKEFNNLKAGTAAALLASLANSYYNRTLSGYYRTDMFAIVALGFLLWIIIRIIRNDKSSSLIYLTLIMLASMWLYPSSFSLSFATSLTFGLYTLLFQRKRLLNYQAGLLMLLCLNPSSYLTLALALIFLVLLLKFPFAKKVKFLLFAFAFALAFLIYNGGIDPLLYQIKAYIFKNTSGTSLLHFYEVNNTIQEAAKIPLSLVMIRIASSITVFILSFIGFGLLLYKQKEMLIALPAVILGLLAYKSGLRFTIYAIFPLALGFGFLLTYVLNRLETKELYKNLLFALAVLLALLPALKHIYDYKTQPVLLKDEAQILTNLSKVADRNDYVLAWWDYGYPIRFYSNAMTLIDGGKHIGRDNFAVSSALSVNQEESARIARFEVEYTKKLYGQKNNTLERMMQDYNFDDVDLFLTSMRGNLLSPPEKTSEIYYYLPYRMLDIFPVVMRFSNLDLKSGQSYRNPLFLSGHFYKEGEKEIILDNGIKIAKNFSAIYIGDRLFPVKEFIISDYNGKIHNNQKFSIDEKADLFVIYMKTYGRFLILDKVTFNSTFVQLFVLGNADENIFELVDSNILAKIYKIKN